MQVMRACRLKKPVMWSNRSAANARFPMKTDSPSHSPAGWRPSPWLLAVGLGVLLALSAALLAWALASMVGGAAGAALAAGLAVAAAALPLSALLVKLVREVRRQREQLARGAGDGSTGHRGHFLALAEREWARVRRYGGEPALLIVDVDRFQRLCESRGPEAGDAVLHALARDFGPTLRGADAHARFGGGQLAVWLAQADPMGALDVADRIRERAEALEVPWQQAVLKVTVSVGVTALRPAHQNLTALIADAESAVQAARQAGGNCVRAAPVDGQRGRRIGPSVGDNQAAGPL